MNPKTNPFRKFRMNDRARRDASFEKGRNKNGPQKKADREAIADYLARNPPRQW